jgi:hypothetical protein
MFPCPDRAHCLPGAVSQQSEDFGTKGAGAQWGGESAWERHSPEWRSLLAQSAGGATDISPVRERWDRAPTTLPQPRRGDRRFQARITRFNHGNAAGWRN